MLRLGLLAAGHDVDDGGRDLEPQVDPLAGRRHRQHQRQLGLQQLVLQVLLDLLLEGLVEEVVLLHLGKLLFVLNQTVQLLQHFFDG